MKVKDILRLKDKVLFTVNPNAPIAEAIFLMDENDVGAVAVVEDGKVVGMLTFREVIAVLARRLKERYAGPTPPILEIFVRDVMFANPPIVSPEMDIDDLRRLMVDSKARYVPVVDGETLICAISLRDIARGVLEEKNFENKAMKAYIYSSPVKDD